MKTGLIMEGGAMRGMFTAGVIDVLMEQNLDNYIDGAVGVSAGASFGCNIKSHQIGRVIRYNKRFCHEKRFCSFWSWLHTGDLYGADFCYRELPDVLDVFDTDTFEKSKMAFWIVCTDAKTGKPLYYRCRDGKRRDLTYIRASASMPVASRPVRIDGRELLDGGISDSIPLKFFRYLGYERNLVILTQPRDYKKEPQSMLPLLRIALRKYPNIWKRLAVRHRAYNRQLAYIRKCEAEGRTLVIAPDEPLGIGSVEHDPNELERVYNIGRLVAEQHIGEIQAFLKP